MKTIWSITRPFKINNRKQKQEERKESTVYDEKEKLEIEAMILRRCDELGIRRPKPETENQ